MALRTNVIVKQRVVRDERWKLPSVANIFQSGFSAYRISNKTNVLLGSVYKIPRCEKLLIDCDVTGTCR